MAMVIIKDTTSPQITRSTFDAIRYHNELSQSEYDNWIEANLNELSIADECNGFSPISWKVTPTSPNTIFNGPFATTTVIFTAVDGCGNEASQTATFQLKEEPNALISGSVFTEQLEEVENVDISIHQNAQGVLGSYLTGADGYFEFELEANQNYEVVPYRNDDPLNGVNTLDLIYISLHILGIDLLDSPYQMIAADVTNNGSITAADLVEIRKLILAINEEFSNNISWRFVDEDFIFPNPNNPFASTFPEVNNITELTQQEIANFIAIKIGDVDGTALPNQLDSGDTRNSEVLNIIAEDQLLKSGQSHTIDFKVDDLRI